MLPEPPPSPTGRALVVGAAIVRDGRLLAMRRTEPPPVAGCWEFPGGKVKRRESASAALYRECLEELGFAIAIDGWLPVVSPIVDRFDLVVAVAHTVKPDAEPTLLVHDAAQWVGSDELDGLRWMPADLPFLPDVAEILRGAA